MKAIILFSILLCVTTSISEGANILVMTPMGSKSHKIFYMGIVKALAERGHIVTVLSAYKESKPMKNVIDLAVPELDVMGVLTDVFKEGGADNLIKDLVMDCPRLCSDGLGLKQVQDLKKEKFDLVMISWFFDFCYFSLIHHFKVPFIVLSPAGLMGPFASMIGSIDFPTIVPNMLLEASFPQTFTQRLKTLGLNFILSTAGNYYILPKSEAVCRERGLCPEDMPPIHHFMENASITILNSIQSLEHPPRPVMPNVIYAGGAHVNDGLPLPKELESWVQGAGEEGFIFFSLGSALKPSYLPENYRKILVKVFGSLKQRVLWKWDQETMVDLPPNVKLGKWLPQQDILAHKKLRLFITHGGYLSTVEATYNGIPVLGMPVYADQYSNMKNAANEGWGRVLLWNDLTEDSLRKVINDIISDKSLTAESRKRSALMRDVPMKPAQVATFWIEFVLRNGGAHHFKSPLFQISWYEFYNLDVYGLLILLASLIIYIEYRILKALLGLCCGGGKGNTKNKSKKKKE